MRLENDHLNTLPNETNFPVDFADTIVDTADKLKTLGERLKVKLHLAGMDAKDLKEDLVETVDGLSRRLSDYAGSLEKTKETAEVQLHLGLMDARKRWEITKEHAGQALDLIREDKQKAKAFLQEMRLQAQLAKVETKDAWEQTKGELSDNWKEISKQGTSALHRMNKSVNDFLHSLS